MEVVDGDCRGPRVHKESIPACVVRVESGPREKPMRRVATTTGEILALSDWLRQLGVTHVAMEPAGVHGKPAWNLLGGEFHLLLINAQHIQQVPGRKTDTQDAEWIADLRNMDCCKAVSCPISRSATYGIRRATGRCGQ